MAVVVLVPQRIERRDDREALGRFVFDARWTYAAGGPGFEYPKFARARDTCVPGPHADRLTRRPRHGYVQPD